MTDHVWPGAGRQPYGYIDHKTGAMVCINAEHWIVHEGRAFYGSHKFTNVANGASVDILMVNPAGNYPHIHQLDVSAGAGNIDFYYYENPTVSANGTAIATPNMNRNSDYTPNLDVYYGPTVTDVGDLLEHMWLPPTATGQGLSREGTLHSTLGREWILKPGESYLLRLTNGSGSTISMMIAGMFYELNGLG